MSLYNTELHVVVTTDFNKTIVVPDPKAARQSKGLISLPPGSIDIKQGKIYK